MAEVEVDKQVDGYVRGLGVTSARLDKETGSRRRHEGMKMPLYSSVYGSIAQYLAQMDFYGV